MEIVKRSPSGLTDKRRNYPIDELRAKFWYAKVLEFSQCKTNYCLAAKWGGEQKKWGKYANGSQPNDDLLNAVESEFVGSRKLYVSGPSDLKLWPAISSDDMDILSLIYEFSNDKLDGEVAEFRLNLINNQIYMQDRAGDRNAFDYPDDIEIWISNIFVGLCKEIGNQLAEESIRILNDWAKPFIDSAYREQHQDFMDVIMPSKYSRESIEQMYRNEEFQSIELTTVKQKGQRKI